VFAFKVLFPLPFPESKLRNRALTAIGRTLFPVAPSYSLSPLIFILSLELKFCSSYSSSPLAGLNHLKQLGCLGSEVALQDLSGSPVWGQGE